MQGISQATIGAVLQQIWNGDAQAAPPIHIWTQQRPEGCWHLGINTFRQYVDEGKELPSAVMILTMNILRGGGPYLFYWVEDPERVELAAQITQWKTGFPRRLQAQEITSMGIGSVL